MKNFVFVNLSIDCGVNTGVNHGIAFLVPLVKEFGFEVSCLNVREDVPDDVFKREIMRRDPAIVGFSATSQQLKYLYRLSHALKEIPSLIQIAGGVGVTLSPDEVLAQSAVDGACVGEGEFPLKDLLGRMKQGEEVSLAEGFYWKKNNGIRKNRIHQFYDDLSALPFPDYSILDPDVVVQEGHLNVMLSRGCPYDCFYCCNKVLGSVYPSSQGYFRLPSVDYSIRLLETLKAQYPQTEYIGFEDDLLIANRSWFLEFARQYRTRIGLPYRIAVRVECVTEDIVEALKDSGCNKAALGLESGNEGIRRTLLNRRYTNEMLAHACRLIKEKDIHLFTFNIVAFPLETKEEMEDTLRLNTVVRPDSGVCTFFYPFKNTELYRLCEEKKLLLDNHEMLSITNYSSRPSIRMSVELQMEAVRIQRRMSAFFAHQTFLWGMRHLPKGWKRYPVMGFYVMRAFLQTHPMLKKIFIALGVRDLLMRLLEKKPV